MVGLCFRARGRFDDGAGFSGGAAAELAHEALDALVIGGESVLVDEFLPDGFCVAADREL